MKLNKMFISIFFSLCFATPLFSCTTQPQSSQDICFKVEWCDYDGTLLESETYLKGSTPIYKKELPTKPSDEIYNYVFQSWSPWPAPIESDVRYYANYKISSKVKYKVVWEDFDGSTIDVQYYEYGSTPICYYNPKRESDYYYDYEFSCWEPTISEVKGDAIYRAQYNSYPKEYTIKWINYDGTLLDEEKYSYNSLPTFKGCEPIKETDFQGSYTFIGWDKEIHNVVSDEVYTARFETNFINYLKLKNDGTYELSEAKKNSTGTYCIPDEYNGKKITSVGSNAFRYTAVEKVQMSNNITQIGAYAFYECNSLKTISLSSNLERIDTKCFYGCTSLLSVSFPENISIIREFAFYGCSSLKEIFIPAGIKSIGSSAFKSCLSIKSITIPIFSYRVKTIFDENITDINLIDGGDKIYDLVFEDMICLETLVIPDSVTSIGIGAFSNCTSLKSITLSKNVSDIGHRAFNNCKSLLSIEIPNCVKSIGNAAFIDCTSLNSIVIPESVTSIGPSAFSGCTNLTNVVINGQITVIEKETFLNCASLETVIINSNLITIDEYAFSGCKSLKNVSINSIDTIEQYSFIGCDSLQAVDFLGNVNVVKDYAFKGCKSISTLDLQNTLKYVGELAFSYCPSLKIVSFGPGTSFSGGAFYSCKSLETVIVGEGTRIINNHMFGECESLSSLSIPNSVTYIGAGAFTNCSSIVNLVLPDSLTVLERDTFDGCSSLHSVIIPKTVSSIICYQGEDYFGGCDNLENVFYCGSEEDYLEIENNESITQEIYYYSESAALSAGNYWHYVDGEPTVW